MRLLFVGFASWVLDGIERRVPRTYRLGGGVVVKRGMTKAEVAAQLGAGREDPKNRTRKIDVEIFWYERDGRSWKARYRGGRLRSIE